MRGFGSVLCVIALAAASATAASSRPPVPFRIKVTIQALQVTDWSASEANIEINSLQDDCGMLGTVAGQGHQEISYSTPAPLVLSEAMLRDQTLRPPADALKAVITRSASLTETFSGTGYSVGTTPVPLCPNGLCPVRSFYWFSYAFPNSGYVPCTQQVTADESGCTPLTESVSQPPSDAYYNQLAFGLQQNELGFGIFQYERPPARCDARWPLRVSFGPGPLITLTALKQRLGRGPVVFRGQHDVADPIKTARYYDPTAPPAGSVTTHNEWTIRIERTP